MSGRELPRLAVLISGRGSNLQRFIDACAAGELAARIALVISNRADAHGLERAQRAGLDAAVIDHRDYETREAFDGALVRALRQHAVDLVVLAGFMRILTPVLIEPYLGRLLNIHPSLLPSFPGLEAAEQAVAHGVRVSGCTVHFVDAGLDQGPIVLQAAVEVSEEDTPSQLARRILAEEHRIYASAVRLFFEGRLRIEGRRVRIEPARGT